MAFLDYDGLSHFKDKLDVEAEGKANVDGYYEELTAGSAEQLISTTYVEDNAPYVFRQSAGGKDIGDRETDMLIGGTIAWNQLSGDGLLSVGSNWDGTTYTSDNNITFTKNSDGSVSITSSNQTARTYVYDNSRANRGVSVSGGDVFLLMASGTLTSGTINISGSFYIGSTWTSGFTSFNFKEKDGAISKAPASVDKVYLPIVDSVAANNGSVVNAKVYVNAFNLTQMFGSTIADYVYSLEQSNAGAGVAWFKNLFPKEYYAYNAGELMSVNTSAHNMTGFNQWDEQWEVGTIKDATGENLAYGGAIRSKNYIPVLPSTNYFFKTPDGFNNLDANSKLYWYAEDKSYLGVTGGRGDVVSTTPDGCYYIRFALNNINTYGHDICINLSWDGSRDGEYEPYELNSYPLDSSLTLRGVPKLDANNMLYYDGDAYEADGTVTRRYATTNMGGLTWTYWTDNLFYAALSVNANAGVMCTKYPTYQWSSLIDKAIATRNVSGYVYINDSSYTHDADGAASLKASLSGVTLVYELATPTAESAEPYQEIQIVNDFGTEEYVDAGATASTPTRDVAIPVGHDTKYSANLKAKLEMAPNSPDGDGDYILRQADGDNTYVPLIIPEELPTKPTADGNYALRCTVSSGTPTLSWVSAT